MAEKTKTPKAEEKTKEFIIPLREKCRVVPRYKKTNKAVKTVKEYLVRHMKIRDRNLNKVKLDKYLNEFLWSRGIKKPPHKIKVTAIKEGDIVKAELAEFPKRLKLKKIREEKMEKISAEVAEKKKVVKAKEEKKPGETEEKKAEEQEKKEAVVEAGKEMEKQMAKKAKHTAKGSQKAPVVHRKALSR